MGLGVPFLARRCRLKQRNQPALIFNKGECNGRSIFCDDDCEFNIIYTCGDGFMKSKLLEMIKDCGYERHEFFENADIDVIFSLMISELSTFEGRIKGLEQGIEILKKSIEREMKR